MCNFLVMINPGEKYIVFFEQGFDKSGWVRFTRRNLKGQIESSGRAEVPNTEGYSIHSRNTTPVYMTGLVTLWLYASSRQELDAQRAKPNTWEVLRICYDTKDDRLELQRHTVEHSIPTRSTTKDFFWWKDVAYLGNYATKPGELEVLDLKASVCRKAEMSASTFVPEHLERDMHDEDYGWHH